MRSGQNPPKARWNQIEVSPFGSDFESYEATVIWPKGSQKMRPENRPCLSPGMRSVGMRIFKSSTPFTVAWYERRFWIPLYLLSYSLLHMFCNVLSLHFSSAGLKDRNRFIFASYLPSYDRSILGTFALAHMLSTFQRPSSNQVFSRYLRLFEYKYVYDYQPVV